MPVCTKRRPLRRGHAGESRLGGDHSGCVLPRVSRGLRSLELMDLAGFGLRSSPPTQRRRGVGGGGWAVPPPERSA
eukprot:5853870-Alexandrium_andersonii.AAC.1